MSNIKFFALVFAFFTSYQLCASPGYDFEFDEQDNISPRKTLLELIAPIKKRHSNGICVITPPTPPTPAIPIQPASKSPITNRRTPASYTIAN